MKITIEKDGEQKSFQLRDELFESLMEIFTIIEEREQMRNSFIQQAEAATV